MASCYGTGYRRTEGSLKKVFSIYLHLRRQVQESSVQLVTGVSGASDSQVLAFRLQDHVTCNMEEDVLDGGLQSRGLDRFVSWQLKVVCSIWTSLGHAQRTEISSMREALNSVLLLKKKLHHYAFVKLLQTNV